MNLGQFVISSRPDYCRLTLADVSVLSRVSIGRGTLAYSLSISGHYLVDEQNELRALAAVALVACSPP